MRELFDEWELKDGIRIEYFQSYRHWTRRYHGAGSAIRPFDDRQPRASWEICPSKVHPQLFEGKLWKCAPLAYLKLQAKKYRLSERWDPYLQYQPLEPDCTPEELTAFFAREDESFCGMCPSQPVPFELPLPLPASAAQARHRLAA